jgi:hypothetical protein
LLDHGEPTPLRIAVQRRGGTIRPVAEATDKPLSEQLEEIRAQLGWVRDYL